MYITWFCYIWRVVVLSFIPSTPKLVNFLHFLESRSWEKNMSTPKLVNFQYFGFQELRKTCMYIYIICIYVHMYSTWFCYIWRVVVLSFIPSTPKLVNFANFLESRNWEKNMSTPKLVNFPHFLDSRSWQKNMSTPKLVNFPHFWIPGVEKKHVCIYIYIYNMYICTYVYYMILLYLEGSGSKFHSVNTKTSQFSSFFGFQELRKNMCI